VIRVPVALAIEIEQSALKSLEQYSKAWRGLQHEELLTIQDRNLNWLSTFNGIDSHEVLASTVGKDYMKKLVELSIIYTILRGLPSYRPGIDGFPGGAQLNLLKDEDG
jgi:hypothetical protein